MSLNQANELLQSDRLNDTDAWRLIALLAPHLKIAHQISGRVRLKLDMAAIGHPDLKRLVGSDMKQTFAQIRGVNHVSVNWMARSCVVEYDTSVIADEAWPDLLGGNRTDSAQVLIDILREKYQEVRHDLQ